MCGYFQSREGLCVTSSKHGVEEALRSIERRMEWHFMLQMEAHMDRKRLLTAFVLCCATVSSIDHRCICLLHAFKEFVGAWYRRA